MNNKLSPLIALLLGVAIATPSLAAKDDPKQKAIKYRTAVMTVMGSNFKPMGAMIKGEAPYDAAVFARHAKDLAAVSSVDILRGFPEDSEGKGSEAKGEIWLEWDDFKDKMADMQREAAALAEVAAAGDKGVIKAQFGKTADACKACHKKFKE